MIVGYPGHFDLPAARRIARRPARSSSTRSSRSPTRSSTIAAASRRDRPPARLLRHVDRIALRRRRPGRRRHGAERALPRRARRLRRERVEVCFVGAEDRLFRPGWQPRERFHVLFVGKLIPLHGLETILEAARLAPEIPFRIVGSGQLDALLARPAANVEWVEWVEYEQLPERDPARGLRARHLRHLREGGAGDPEQGLPGARLRHAARDRRHAGGARAPRATRRARCSFRPATRPRSPPPCAGSRATPSCRAALAPEASPPTGSTRARTSSAHRWRGLLEAELGGPPTAVSLRPRRPLGGRRRLHGRLRLPLVLRHLAFSTGRFDLGNMTQAVWSTAHGDVLAVTDLARRADLAARRALRPDPRRLRAALVALARSDDAARRPRRPRSRSAPGRSSCWRASTSAPSGRALGFALAYLLYPPTQWLALNEFHAVALATPLLLFAFWFLDEDRLVPFSIVAALACLTKEHVALAVAALGRLVRPRARTPPRRRDHRRRRRRRRRFRDRRRRPTLRPRRLLAVRGPLSRPSAARRSGSSRPPLTDPRSDRRAGVRRAWHPLPPRARAAAPRPAAPGATRCPHRRCRSWPRTSSRRRERRRSIHFHYTAAAIPGLMAAAVLGAAACGRAAVDFGLSSPQSSWPGSLRTTRSARCRSGGRSPGERRSGARARVSARTTASRSARSTSIPDDAVVSATNSLGGHLSERRRVLSFPVFDDATWIAADETRVRATQTGSRRSRRAERLRRLRLDPRWRIVFEEDGDRRLPAALEQDRLG